jgi:hypothetical protein
MLSRVAQLFKHISDGQGLWDDPDDAPNIHPIANTSNVTQ